MAPSSLVSAAASLWTKCFSVYSCTTTLASRGPSFFPASTFCVKWLSTTTSGPPKRPLNAYMRYVQQHRPAIVRLHPEITIVDVVKKIAQEWRTLSPEQKRPFEEASVKAREQFRVDLKRYMAQLTPVQEKQQALDKEQMLAKRKSIDSLGKPKRSRTSFNIFMSERFEEAIGTTRQVTGVSVQDWRNLFSHQKQVYTQLAQDDKIRYENEIKSWEEHMIEIGRADLIRKQIQSKNPKEKSCKKGITLTGTEQPLRQNAADDPSVDLYHPFIVLV
uniref:Transcription factor A, mitochondrial n=1 Tax=Neogobius melanostomus TaxID=47308 RepID=A0A8C6T8E7_9GOBI